MKVYLAGPDVFRLDAEDWAIEARALCVARGLIPLLPLDGTEITASGIYLANRKLLTETDVVVANLNPFRGSEPESGTCVEIGMALALGKPVIGYLDDHSQMIHRVAVRRHGEHYLCGDGLKVENFGMALNLMLGVPARIIKGGLADALDALVMAETSG